MDASENLVTDFIIEINEYEQEVINSMRNILYKVIYNYNISKKSTALAKNDNTDIEIIKMFFAVKKIEGLSESSLLAYKTELESLFSKINKSIKDIATNDVRYYLAISSKTASSVTLNNKRRILCTFFKFLEQEEYIIKNPMTRIKQIKEEKKIKAPFTSDELEKIRESCIDERDEALVEFLYSTGCRISEACGVDIEDIAFDKNEVKVFGKGKKERIVYINARAKIKIKNYIQERSCGPLFITCKRANEKYERLNSNSLRMIFNKIGKRAGIKNCHPHKMRRTMATKALRSGMKLDEVQKILGHEDIQTTTIYAETDMQDVKRKHEHLF